MKYFKALSVLLLAGAVCAQDPGYNYPKPNPPKNSYLPPKNEQQAQIAAEGLSPDGEHEPGMPFDFTYAVKDDVGNDFSHNAESNGDVVKGEYRTLLPDGRTQIVKYTADWKNGYNAEITYEGEAVYPEEKPQPPRPAPTQRPQPPRTTKNPYASDTDIDSQGLLPSTQGYNYPKPTTTTRRPPPQTRPPTQRTTRPPPPPPQTRPPTQRTTRPPPPPPPGLYDTPAQPFGVRNNPKFGYSK